MTPPVPSIRGERVVRALEKAGFAVARIAGSHHIMRHPDGRGTTVPVHHGRDVAKGTLRGILGHRYDNRRTTTSTLTCFGQVGPHPIRGMRAPSRGSGL